MNDDRDRIIESDDTQQPQSSNYGKHPVGQTPLDPTDNAQGMMNDTSGITGVSKDTNNPNTPPNQTGPISRTMSDFQNKVSRDVPPEKDEFENKEAADMMPEATPGSTPTGNKVLDENPQPEIEGEAGMGGSTMPDPASDDDTLANAHNVGLRLDEDEEHPQELDIGSDMDKAEEYKRTH